MNLKRREFLKVAGVAGVASVAPAAAARQQHAAGESHDWMGMLIDLTVCIGCRRCEWACKRANGLSNGESIDDPSDDSVFDKARRPDAENLTVVNRFAPADPDGAPVHVKTQCMHCVEPACASACLVGAFKKTPEGPVVYDESVCIGCRYCMMACPFNVPAYTYDDPTTPVVRKCSMCFERVRRHGGAPACAEVCPVEAITYGKRSELLALARKKIAEDPERYVDHIYGEHEAGGTCCLYLSGRSFEELGFRADVGTTPYPELTKDFLSSVPLVLTIWPALLMGAYAFTKHREERSQAGGGDRRESRRETESRTESREADDG